MSEAKYYENPDLWARERYTENEDELRRFVACTDLLPKDVKSILDAGAGNGAFMYFLEEESVPVNLVGLERSRIAIESSLSSSTIHQGSIDNMPFLNRSFDLVSCLEVIEHLPYKVYENSLRELERVADKYILLSVPYKEERIQVRCPYCSCTFNPYYHMRSFDETTLSNIFESFCSVSFVKVMASDYIWGSQLRKIYNRIPNGRIGLRSFFPSTALCPQCGFAGANGFRASASEQSVVSNLIRSVKKAVPKQQTERWIVALYERSD